MILLIKCIVIAREEKLRWRRQKTGRWHHAESGKSAEWHRQEKVFIQRQRWRLLVRSGRCLQLCGALTMAIVLRLLRLCWLRLLRIWCMFLLIQKRIPLISDFNWTVRIVRIGRTDWWRRCCLRMLHVFVKSKHHQFLFCAWGSREDVWWVGWMSHKV